MNTGEYDLELNRLYDEIQRVEAKRVLIQLPDGLKPYANKILDAVHDKFPDVNVVFWAASCFGACDAPIHVRQLGFDLLVQFGHAPWRY